MLDMVYGIDFGTTYTVVSCCDENGQISFIKFDGEVLLPTDISGIKNLKRVLLNQEKDEKFLKNSKFLNILVEFFKYVKKKIIIQTEKDLAFLNCVITVPVRFNDFNRYLIKYAAILAGFNVVKLIHEPVAAAIAVINKFDEKNGNYIVYDLGGGTFDATLIKKHYEVFQVLKVDGLENFGGVDLDEFIAKDLKISLYEAEKLKRTNYLESLDAVLDKTYKIIDEISENEDILALILNGGSSYLKNIQIYYQNKFRLLKADNLQTLVSEGAALYGKNFINQSQFLIDITPFNLGVEVLGDKLEVLIEANSPIPIKKSEMFVPVNNKVAVNILQGSSLIASECEQLGKIVVETNRPFEISFILDCDGILTVQALDKTIVFYDVFKT